jgi:CRP-like cAMP-binding protein
MQAAELCRQMTWFARRSTLSSRQLLEWILCQFTEAPDQGPLRASTRVRLPLRRWELARLIGISPEHLCRLTKQLQEDGLIRCESGWIVVSDIDRLRPKSQPEDGPCCCVAVEMPRTDDY